MEDYHPSYWVDPGDQLIPLTDTLAEAYADISILEDNFEGEAFRDTHVSHVF